MSEQNISGAGKSGKFRFSIGFKLVSIISLIIVVSLVAMNIVAGIWYKGETEKIIQGNTLDLSMRSAMKVSSDFSSIMEKGNIIAAALAGEIGSVREKEIFKDLFFSRDRDLIFIGIGIREASGAFVMKEKLINPAFFDDTGLDQNSLTRAIDADRKHFEKSFSSATEVFNASSFFNRPVLGISAPYSKKSSDSADAILIIYVRTDRFQEAVKSSGVFKTYVVNASGDAIAHYDPAAVLSGANLSNVPIVASLLTGLKKNEQTRFKDDHGKWSLGTYNRIAFGNIGVVVTIDESVAFSVVEKIRRRNIYITLIVLSAAILIVYFFSKTITFPLVRLVSATKKIEGGDFSVRMKSTSNDEIGDLTESFSQMGQGLAEREKMKDAFGKFVNKDIADRILRDEIKLGGERKQAAIFFSDIRSFTEISENLQPEEVVEFLNEYMTRMVGCVNTTHGVVDKFIGDAIMAVWGTPVSHGNDTENAVNAALMMRASLAEFNAGRGGPKKPLIKIGCGINTGPVLAGQIGSHDRMEYTVIGDAVNLASRVESLNKPFGTDILISEDAYELVKDIVNVAAMQKIKVKGKKESQQIYAVLGRKDDAASFTSISQLRAFLGIDVKDLPSFNPDKEEQKYSFVNESPAAPAESPEKIEIAVKPVVRKYDFIR
jgi:adenylate cyclase